MNKAVCYVRVSTEEQAREGVSLEAQEEKLRAYCKMAGLEIIALLREEACLGASHLQQGQKVPSLCVWLKRSSASM